MKQHTLKTRAVDRDLFEAVCAGRKKLELRAGSPRYRSVAVGDRIRFICEKDVCMRSISVVQAFSNLDGAIEHYGIQALMPGVEDEVAYRKRVLAFPGYQDRMTKSGVIVFELK